MSVTCEKEIGRWTIRVNGMFIGDFLRRGKAFEFAHRLAAAIHAEER